MHATKMQEPIMILIFMLKPDYLELFGKSLRSRLEIEGRKIYYTLF